MNTEDENPASPRKLPAASKHAPPPRQSKKITYTREFLLSLGSLDICKKLPEGCNALALNGLEVSSSTLERPRTFAALPPSNRSEGSSSYSRGSAGRWDTRSSGSSDRDLDLQSDQDAFAQDSGRRFGNQTRRPWQLTEHDGLLGSGAFPRPSGSTGAPVPKARGNGNYQLNRSTEPYQPPRPYKAAPYSRNSTDSYNDETFGSAEYSSEDRAEEERKRRESFELMRKEQQKSLQEKQKHTTSHKENLGTDISALLGNSEVEKTIRNKSSELDDPMIHSLLQDDSSTSSFHTQVPAFRPPVPPGFGSTLTEKNISVQSSSLSIASEAANAYSMNTLGLSGIDNDQEKRNHSTAFKYLSMQKNDSKNTSVHLTDEYQSNVSQSSAKEVLQHSGGSGNMPSKIFSLQDYNEVWEEDVVKDLSSKKETRSEIMNVADHSHSTSILEKFFGSALSGSSTFIEAQDVKAEEESASAALSESSKFAHWFLREENMAVEDSPSRDLLYLITSNETTGSQSTSDKGTKHVPPSLPSENKDHVAELHALSATPTLVGIPDPYSSEKLNSCSGVLTCTDLEQFILAEVKESSSSLQHSQEGYWLDGKSEEPKAGVIDHASKHLLSLLNKGTSLKESPSSPRIDVKRSSDKLASLDLSGNLSLSASDNAIVTNSETTLNSKKSLTLETLFGAAFMNELHSVKAPLSINESFTSNDAIQPHSFAEPHADTAFFSSTSNEHQTNQSNLQWNLETSIGTRTRAHNTPELWVRGRNLPNQGSMIADASFEECAAEVQLPEEDSLITVGDTLNPTVSNSSRNANKDDLIPENAVELLNDNLLNAILRDGQRLKTHGLDGQPLVPGLYDMVDSDSQYNRLHGRPSPQFLHQMNQKRPSVTHLDHLTYGNPHMRYMGSGDVHHDPYHSFPVNAIPQHGFNYPGGPRFDPALHHQMLQNMPIPPNFQSHHAMQGLPRGIPLSHPTNHMPGYSPEMNHVHNFPFNSQQNNFGGPGIGMPGVRGGGGPQPEALERLIEMERRAKSKQIHPAAGGHIPGIYGHELDRNFRYR